MLDQFLKDRRICQTGVITWITISGVYIQAIFAIKSEMEWESLGTKKEKQDGQSDSSKKSSDYSRNLYALIGENTFNMPYRSKFELESINSGNSRQSRDSDLLNRLANLSSKASSKSLSKNISASYIKQQNHKSLLNSSNSNSGASISEESVGKQSDFKPIDAANMAPKIHNCVCFAAGECLNYNCNCFLSPFPCAPQCCQNCLTLKANLPLKVTNMCSCKKTKCLKLYCECLSKGQYCGVMCRCQRCENHQHSTTRASSINVVTSKGCSCQKSHCQKKYCDCFSQGIKCTNKCGCIGCKNYIDIKMEEQVAEKMDLQPSEEHEGADLEFEQIDFFGGGSKR